MAGCYRRRAWMWLGVMVAATSIAMSFVVTAVAGDRETKSSFPPTVAYGVEPTIEATLIGNGLQVAHKISAGASLPEIAPTDRGDGQGKRFSVLVHMDPLLGRRALQRVNVRSFAGQQGAYVKYEYDSVLPHVVNLRDVPESQLAALRKMPGVVRVERDKVVHAYLADSTPLIRALQSQITGAGLSANGSGVRVCIIDTGIDSDNQMYSSRIDTAAGRDFVNNDNNPEDDNGHGSHVAGIALGGTGISRTVCSIAKPFQGVAPHATLIGVKVLDSTGNGSFSNVVAGINYCADQTANGGRADIINMSLGAGQFTVTCDTDSGAAAANNAVNAGVVVIAASGNDGFANAMGTPACGSKVISVGATYDADFPNCANATSSFNWGICIDNNPAVDSIVCFSNKSDLLDVVAPGCDIISASIATGGTSFAAMCGTSMATPHVAGLAALLLSADPNLTPAQVRQMIRDGAIDFGAAGFDRSYGFGRIDAIGSLQFIVPCATNSDCDDGDPCTADVCSAGVCSSTPISCPAGQACVGGSCQGQGACCTGVACRIDTQATCTASGGSYLGDGSMCGSGTAGNPTAYQSTPNAAIPDGGGVGNPVTDTINVPDTFAIGDVNVGLNISHTWVGDLTVTVSHLGTTVTVLDRPGVPATNFGCSLNNFSGIILDDEGTGGAIEDQCSTNLSSPPNYVPNNSLTAFDGLDAAGVWTITVFDSVTPDSGSLNTWSLDVDALGSNPCTGGCTTNAQCDDGNVCTTDTCDPVLGCLNDGMGILIACDDANVCTTGDACQGDAVGTCAGTDTSAADCDDGIACTTDTCHTVTGCASTPSNAACDDGNVCTTDTCDAALGCLNDGTGITTGCDDGNACTTGDACQGDAAGTCAGTDTSAVHCDDGIACTTDTCDTFTGCANTPVPLGTACGDPTVTPCDGADSCDGQGVCQANLVVDGTSCSDGLFCNGAEVCMSGVCGAGASVCTDVCEHCDEPGSVCRWCLFDHNQSGLVDGFDFSFLSGCFGACVPPTDPCAAANYDNDPNGCVGGGDFGVFSGCFGLGCGQCPACSGAASALVAPGGPAAMSSPLVGASVQLVAVQSPNGDAVSAALPSSVKFLPVGGRLDLEVWASVWENGPEGFASVYADVTYDPRRLVVEKLVPSALFTTFAHGSVETSAGLIAGLGGCAPLGEATLGTSSMWVRVATIRMRARGTGSAWLTAMPSHGAYGVSLFGRFGDLPTQQVEYGSAKVEIRPLKPVANDVKPYGSRTR